MPAIDPNNPYWANARNLIVGFPALGSFYPLADWDAASWNRKRVPRDPPSSKTINTYLPMELMREIFLYSIESNQIKSGQLASVCCYWRSVITTMSHLWSTLRVGTWTETEQVVTWLQRANPKKVIIDTQRDRQLSSNALPLAALQDALAHTRQWRELTISSFPPEDLASQLGIQVASPMKVLKMLCVAAGCMDSPSFAHLLNLVPTEAPLCEMRLYSPFTSTHFLQPHWIPVLRNLMVLIVNGRDIHEPFELLPTFTQLQRFEADRLRLPLYAPNTNLPLLRTLRKLQLRACSVQWMAGRQFPCLEECAILLPCHLEQIQWHQVQLPSCTKFAYHGYPMTTAQYFHVPKMRTMDLRSHDCDERRIYQHLRHLCRVDGRIYNLTTLRLTLQGSEEALMKILKYLVPLQDLALSITHPSLSFQTFLGSLAAKPSANEWPGECSWISYHRTLEEWCSSQTWHADVLPNLKFLSIQCPKGFSQSERLDNFPLLRFIGWTRAYLAPALEHLKVWEGSTSGTLIRGLSGPNLPSRFTPLKGSAVSSQQSAVNIVADGRLHLATLMAPYEQALRAAIIFVYIIGLHELKIYNSLYQLHCLDNLRKKRKLQKLTTRQHRHDTPSTRKRAVTTGRRLEGGSS